MLPLLLWLIMNNSGSFVISELYCKPGSGTASSVRRILSPFVTEINRSILIISLCQSDFAAKNAFFFVSLSLSISLEVKRG